MTSIEYFCKYSNTMDGEQIELLAANPEIKTCNRGENGVYRRSVNGFAKYKYIRKAAAMLVEILA